MTIDRAALATPASVAGRDRFILPIFGACLFVTLLVAGSVSPGPVVQADEGSYLLNAAAIAGVLSHSALLFEYYSGYSLLLAPLFAIFSDVDRVYRATLVLNALLACSVPFALYRFLRAAAPGVDDRWRLLAAISASCYAPILVLSQYALSDNALIPAFAWALAAGALAVTAGSARWAIAAGVLAGFLFLVHARGATLALPLLAALSLPAIGRRELRAIAAAMWIAAIGVALLHGPLELAAGKTGDVHLAGFSARDILARFTHGTAWLQAGMNAAGAATYAMVASVGIAAIALKYAGATVLAGFRRDPGQVSAPTAMLLAVVFAFACSLLVTAAFFVPPARTDHVVYGRYLLPAMVPLVAYGLCRMCAPRRARIRDGILATLSIIAGIGGMAVAFRLAPPPDAWATINSVGLFIPYRLGARHLAWHWVLAYSCLLAGILHVASLVSARLALAAFSAIQLVIALSMFQLDTVYSRRYYASERTEVMAARDFRSVTGVPLCIGFSPELTGWHVIDLSTRLLGQLRESTRAEQAGCVQGLISRLPSPNAATRSMRLVATGSRAPWGSDPIGLFVADGAAVENYASSRELPPLDAARPLPPHDRLAEVGTLQMDFPARIAAGTVLNLSVRVKNRGTATWSTSADSLLPYPVLLGARMDGPAGAAIEFRSRLARALAPGDATDMTIAIGPLATPGNYQTRIGVVQEHVAWFSGGTALSIEVIDPVDPASPGVDATGSGNR